MNAQDVVTIYSDLEALGITIWLDGGWGVDALLGEQTRPHDDVDLVIQERDLPALRAYLLTKQYQDVPRDDTRAWNFVVGDANGRLIDVHVIVLDENGNGIYGPVENGVMYPASALTGMGNIMGVPVRCLTAEYQLESHSGYELREKDHADVEALRTLFSQ